MRRPDPFLPTAAKVSEAHARWQRLSNSAAAGHCSPCFAQDALRTYTDLHNKRAAAKLRARPPVFHPPMSLDCAPTFSNYGESTYHGP